MRNIYLLVNSMHSGGAERVAANLANAWSRDGHRVRLVITFSGRGDCHYTLDAAVEVTYLNDVAAAAGSGLRAYWKRFMALRRLIRAGQPDVVVSFLTNVNVAALLASAGLGVPVIVSERTHPPTAPLSAMWVRLRRLTYPFAYRVVMLSSDGLAWLETTMPRARGLVISNPVEYPLARGEPVAAVQEYLGPGRKVLLAVGRLDDGKQFDRLLMAFHDIACKHADWDLAIIGEGPNQRALGASIAELGLQSRVVMTGRVGNVGDWYERADLYVMTSKFEGFPNTLAEAMAHGCPAVSYDCDTGPRDIIRHGIDGLLVEQVGDVPALAAALDRLMGSEELRSQMGAQAMEVRVRFSMRSVLERWYAVFPDWRGKVPGAAP